MSYEWKFDEISQFCRRLDSCCRQMSHHSIHALKVQSLTLTFKLQRVSVETTRNLRTWTLFGHEWARLARLPHRCGAHQLWVNFLVCFPLQAFQFFFSLWTTQIFILTIQIHLLLKFLARRSVLICNFKWQGVFPILVLLQECLSQSFLDTNRKCNRLVWSPYGPVFWHETWLAQLIFFGTLPCTPLHGILPANEVCSAGVCWQAWPLPHLTFGRLLPACIFPVYLLVTFFPNLLGKSSRKLSSVSLSGLHGHQRHQKGWFPFQGRSLVMPHGHLPFPRANPAWRPHQIAACHHHHNPLRSLRCKQNMFQNERLNLRNLTLRIPKIPQIPLLLTHWQQHHSISTTKVGSSRECATPWLINWGF